MTLYTRGTLLAMGGTFVYGLLSLSIKASGEYADVWQIMTGRGLGGLLLAFLCARALGIRLVNGQVSGMLLTAVCNFSAVSLITLALTTIPLFEALVLWYLLPVWMTLFSRLLLGERVSRFGLCCTALAVSGTMVVLWPQSGATFSGLSWGHLAALCSPIAASAAFVLIRLHAAQPSLAHFFYLSAVTLVASSLALLLQGVPAPLPLIGVARISLVALLAGMGQVMVFAAVACISPSVVAVICLGEIVIAAIGAYVLFDERLTLNMACGGAMIVIAAVGINWYHVARNKRPAQSLLVE